jgi:hypothetical protein
MKHESKRITIVAITRLDIHTYQVTTHALYPTGELDVFQCDKGTSSRREPHREL